MSDVAGLSISNLTVKFGGLTALDDVFLEIAPNTIVDALVKSGVRVEGFSLDAPTLEERFVSLTGEGFDVAG